MFEPQLPSQPQPVPELDVSPEEEREAALLEAYCNGDAVERHRLRQEHPELADFFNCLDALEKLQPQAKAPPASAPVKPAPISSGDAVTVQYAEPAQGTAATAPRRFGRYELLEEIGRGGMGVVYRARHVELNRVVAVKMILSGYLADREQIRRFQQEARTAAQIRHANIVSVFDYGETDGHHYFAMDYVAGQSLQQVLQRGPLAVDVAARLVATIAHAVAHLHQHGIVHRDLKPSNVLLDEHGQPYVSDFGLAKWLQENEVRTVSGTVLGTPSYMAPEQAQGQTAQISPRTDVYSLGAILYALLTGRPPFAGDNPLDVILQVLESEPPNPRQLRPEIPRDLEWICLKCLEKDPQQRYATAAELAADLERFLQGETPAVAPYSGWQRLRRWFRREPAFGLHLLGLALVTLIVQMNQWLNPGSKLSPRVHVDILGVLGIWAAVLVLLRWVTRFPKAVQYLPACWCLTDIALLTLVLWLADDQLTPVVAAYPAFVVGSGLWGRRSVIRLTTAAAVVAYALLIAEHAWRLGGWQYLERPHHHLLFAVLLILTGEATAWQVARLQALHRYCRLEPGEPTSSISKP
ncbi:Serine/threonine-protein kinase PrkC [bacterium HR36]|nr:Serine/threonine-protein kinase PrkC [bacterium HR36]